MQHRRLSPLAMICALALTAAACGSDGGSTDAAADAATDTTVAAAGDDAMVDDEMSDDEMSDDEMADDEMSDDEMSDDEMSDGEMSDDEMSDDEMSDDEMSDSMAEEGMAEASGDLLAVAAGRDDLSTLVAAVEAAGLGSALAGDGPFTIFAPNDDAFLDYLGEMGMSVDDALADTTFLSTLLQGHVVEAGDDAAMVAGMVDNPFVSLAGTELPVTVDGGTITIGGAEILETDIFATNGVIHVIDTVLAPAG
ncbi:MAG: fasciclin domain-containing protein [Acidimicrobiales bacterium]